MRPTSPSFLLPYYLARGLVFLHKLTAPLRDGLLLTVFGYASQCRHSPTCSEYLLRQVSRHGWSGFPQGVKRLFACH